MLMAAPTAETGPRTNAKVTCRECSGRPMHLRFLALGVRPAGVRPRYLVQQAANQPSGTAQWFPYGGSGCSIWCTRAQTTR